MSKFKLMILVSSPEEAEIAQKAGVDRIFYDLEYINKAERQRGRNTVISNNHIDNLPKIREVVSKSELLVRTNPIHAYSSEEIGKAIRYGADILMLPMATTVEEVAQFVSLVNGRAKVCIMIETAQALARVNDFLKIKDIDEFFIGLNDLHISMNLSFMFELMSGGIVEYLAECFNRASVPWGVGGIARIGEGTLPAERILAEHVRLGSSSVILSRTFKGLLARTNNIEITNIDEEIQKIRDKYEEICSWESRQFEDNKTEIHHIVTEIVGNV